MSSACRGLISLARHPAQPGLGDHPGPARHQRRYRAAPGSMARWLDTSPQMWLNLQAIHDLRKAEDVHGAEIHDRVTPLAPRQTG